MAVSTSHAHEGAESEIRHRGGPGRDLDAARAAYDVGDVDASRAAHETKIHSDEHHAGCVWRLP